MPEDVLLLLMQLGQNFGTNAANTEFQARQNEINRQWQEDMWNKMNEYNSPVNQRKRLEAAGINPNLAFGSAASAMSGSVPGSPGGQAPRVSAPDLAEFWVKIRQAKADIKAQEAGTRRQDEITDQLKMTNQVLSSLLTDKIETEKGDMFVRRIEQAWKEDHLRDFLDLGITEKEARIDLLKAEKLFKDAATSKSVADRERIIQEFNHLTKKYGFEDLFYGNNMNPYETNTLIGFGRYIFGPLFNFMRVLNNVYDLDLIDEDQWQELLSNPNINN